MCFTKPRAKSAQANILSDASSIQIGLKQGGLLSLLSKFASEYAIRMFKKISKVCN